MYLPSEKSHATQALGKLLGSRVVPRLGTRTERAASLMATCHSLFIGAPEERPLMITLGTVDVEAGDPEVSLVPTHLVK